MTTQPDAIQLATEEITNKAKRWGEACFIMGANAKRWRVEAWDKFSAEVKELVKAKMDAEALADSEGTRAVGYLRRARAAEAKLDALENLAKEFETMGGFKDGYTCAARLRAIAAAQETAQ